MSRAIKDSAATRSLRTRVELRSTGKLTVGAGAVEVAVHLLNGDILAATAADDDRQVVRILHLLGLIDDERADELEDRLEGGNDVLGDLFGLDLGPTLDQVLQERFVQNLCDFVSSLSTPKFTEQKGVFVANIQMGHDTPALIEEVCRLADLAKAIDLDALVVRGRVPPGPDPARGAVAECLGHEPRTVSSLLHEVPVESTRARVVLSELLLDGVASPYTGEEMDDVPLEDDETVSSDWPPKYLRRPSPPPTAPEPAATQASPPAQRTPEPAPRAAEPAVVAAEPEEPPGNAPQADQDDIGEDELEPLELDAEELLPPELRDPEPAPVDDPNDPLSAVAAEEWPSEEDDPRTPPSLDAPREQAPVGAPRSLSDWLSGSSAVGEDELDFFSDHDYDRGQGGGGFKSDSHNLDKVEVGSMDSRGPREEEPDEAGAEDDDPIEAEEAPSARFGAPTISEDEACAKIDVANEVLAVILEAFDEAEGPGRGRAVLQLLVDGVPSQYASLLRDLRIGEDNALPFRVVLRNLAARPPTEHRLLLNNGLADIIERALSSAADELPDEQVDAVLESVAGYRSRLGL